MTSFWDLVGAISLAYIQQVSAVTYESPMNVGVAEKYTFIAIGAVLAIPIIFGYVYTRITLRRIRKLTAGTELKSGLVVDSASASVGTRQAGIGAHFFRLLDMKSNPVLRLWWKRQEKLYSQNGADNDLEAQLVKDERKGSSSIALPKPKKDRRPKLETSGTGNTEVDPVDDATKRSKKEKKLKRENVADVPVEKLLITREDLVADEPSEKKPSKHKKEKKLTVAFSESRTSGPVGHDVKITDRVESSKGPYSMADPSGDQDSQPVKHKKHKKIEMNVQSTVPEESQEPKSELKKEKKKKRSPDTISIPQSQQP
jgi:hypothetical protein